MATKISSQIAAEEAAGYELESTIDYIVEQARTAIDATDTSYVGGEWYWPTPDYYYVSYGFGGRVHPLYGTNDFHNGIDILGDYGAKIVAARSGLVSYAGWMSGYGNTVIIDHGDGTQSLYAHGSEIVVDYAQMVKAGDYIMAMGSTGVSTANHLHFGVMSDGYWVNPSNYVGY